MADFVAVLKKTIDGLGDTTPEVREKVYQKARTTIGAKLAALNPPPPPAVVDRQRQALEDAIKAVEQDYAARDRAPEEDPLDELDALFSTGPKPAAPKPEPARAEPARNEPPREAAKPAAPATSPAPAATVAAASAAAPAAAQAAGPEGFKPVQPKPAPQSLGIAPPAAKPVPRDEPAIGPIKADAAGTGAGARAAAQDDDLLEDPVEIDEDRFAGAGTPPPNRSRMAKLAAGAAAAILVFGGVGYAFWANQDEIAALFGGSPVMTTEVAPDATPVPAPEENAEASAEAPLEDEEDIAALAPAEPVEEAAAEDEPSPVIAPESEAETDAAPKFTQRLNPDGTEIDVGPANGEPTIGEGTSVAAATQAAEAPAPDAPAAAGETAIPVGQKAIFYEERTSVAAGSAEPGTTVWSIVQESPGNDLPPEPAIRAEATVPGKDIQLRMTIRRNADKTLPASHIVELIFLTPDNFAGGSIDNVLRMTMKNTEEAAGNPLQGMTAKIADGFFLLALNDDKPSLDTNNTLMRRESWIDVPIVYKSGRRALMTMEKGIPGEQVFEQAMRAWQEADSG